MATMEISLVPLGTGSTSVGAHVAACQRILASRNDIRYELGPMGTAVEGSLDALFELARLLHEVPFAQGVQRVYTVIKLDDRRDRPSTLASKVRSVQDRLQAPGD